MLSAMNITVSMKYSVVMCENSRRSNKTDSGDAHKGPLKNLKDRRDRRGKSQRAAWPAGAAKYKDETPKPLSGRASLMMFLHEGQWSGSPCRMRIRWPQVATLGGRVRQDASAGTPFERVL